MPDTGMAFSVDVHLMDSKIEMDDRLYAGRTNFVIHNKGQQPHSLKVEGQGVHAEFDTEIQPGATEIMQVELMPGTYTLSCPMPHHDGQEPQFEFSVTGPRQAAGTG